MIIRIISYILAITLLIIMSVVVLVNVKIHYRPQVIVQGSDTVQFELLQELRGLKKALNENADLEMQGVYPEGYVFLNAIYALAWSNFIDHDEHQRYFEEGHSEIHKAWSKIDSETGKSSFTESLSLRYGSYYTGWSTFVLGSKLRLEPTGIRNEIEVRQFIQRCEGIASAIQVNTYPESYEGAGWPADVMLCVAALSIHDQIFEPRFSDIINDWLKSIQQGLDSRGMVPHAVLPEDRKGSSSARGSSMALMLIFLREIDKEFAFKQFDLFKANFVDRKFGLTGIREYPKGVSGRGDIDSGPVFLGFGGAATIVGMYTLSIYGELEPSLTVRNAVEVMAMPTQLDDRKHYFFGMVPIADAFIAWSHSGMKRKDVNLRFVAFHVLSLLFFVFLSACFWLVIQKISLKGRNALI